MQYGGGKSVRRIWFGQVMILLNNFSSEEMYKSWKSARSGEQKPAKAATNESKDLLSVVGVGESPSGVGCMHEFCDGDCAEDIMQ